MKQIIHSDSYGEIVYNESFWSGKKSIYLNGELLKEADKNNFENSFGERVHIDGTPIKGIKLVIGKETMEISKPIAWYEWILIVLPLFFILIWSCFPDLTKYFPLVGGLFGGLIGGFFVGLNVAFSRIIKKLWQKILVYFAMFLANIIVNSGLCFIVAMIIKLVR